MNLITQYEQGYIDRNTFFADFPDSISESQESIFGEKCINFYVELVLGKHKFDYYINPYNVGLSL